MINYVKGDLFKELSFIQSSDRVIIVPHVVNDLGAFGAGFASAVRKHFPVAAEAYHKHHEEGKLKLGENQVCYVRSIPPTNIVHMCAQKGLISKKNPHPLQYRYLMNCMRGVVEFASGYNCEIWAPKFGSGLAGGYWPTIASLIEEIWLEENISVTIFELEEKK